MPNCLVGATSSRENIAVPQNTATTPVGVASSRESHVRRPTKSRQDAAPATNKPDTVCLLDAWLDDKTMQNIAAENNLAETAFIVACYAENGGQEKFVADFVDAWTKVMTLDRL